MRVVTDKVPPPIPGLKYWADSKTADGPVCALQAAGLTGGPTQYAPVPHLPQHVKWRPYQEAGISTIYGMLKQFTGAILGDDMGLGKTPQGAAVAAMLRKRTLVVCPAAVRHQWQKWMYTMHEGNDNYCCAILGPPSEKLFQPEWGFYRSKDARDAVVSYNLMEQAFKCQLPELVIFDEPHNYLQGRANKYVKVWWKYGGAVQYKLALTGTPYLSRPAGLWQLLNVILGMRFGKAREFDIRYCNGNLGQWGWDSRGVTNAVELKTRLSHYMVRRMKADVAKDLPKVTRTVRWCEADPKATAALAMADHTISGMRGAVRSTLHGKDGELLNLMDEAENADQPTVVFTWLREDAQRLGALLNTKGYPTIVITGDDTAAKRASLIDVARIDCTNVVATYGAAGQGLDGLQRWCSNTIYHAIDPVPAILLQASGRLDRIGQTMPVTETFLAMRESVDELTVDKVVNRLDVWTQVLGSDKSSTEMRNALVRGGLNPDDDAVLNAIFKEMTDG